MADESEQQENAPEQNVGEEETTDTTNLEVANGEDSQQKQLDSLMLINQQNIPSQKTPTALPKRNVLIKLHEANVSTPAGPSRKLQKITFHDSELGIAEVDFTGNDHDQTEDLESDSDMSIEEDMPGVVALSSPSDPLQLSLKCKTIGSSARRIFNSGTAQDNGRAAQSECEQPKFRRSTQIKKLAEPSPETAARLFQRDTALEQMMVPIAEPKPRKSIVGCPPIDEDDVNLTIMESRTEKSIVPGYQTISPDINRNVNCVPNALVSPPQSSNIQRRQLFNSMQQLSQTQQQPVFVPQRQPMPPYSLPVASSSQKFQNSTPCPPGYTSPIKLPQRLTQPVYQRDIVASSPANMSSYYSAVPYTSMQRFEGSPSTMERAEYHLNYNDNNVKYNLETANNRLACIGEQVDSMQRELKAADKNEDEIQRRSKNILNQLECLTKQMQQIAKH